MPRPSPPGSRAAFLLPEKSGQARAGEGAWARFSPAAWLALVFQDGPWGLRGEGAGSGAWAANAMAGHCQKHSPSTFSQIDAEDPEVNTRDVVPPSLIFRPLCPSCVSKTLGLVFSLEPGRLWTPATRTHGGTFGAFLEPSTIPRRPYPFQLPG